MDVQRGVSLRRKGQWCDARMNKSVYGLMLSDIKLMIHIRTLSYHEHFLLIFPPSWKTCTRILMDMRNVQYVQVHICMYLCIQVGMSAQSIRVGMDVCEYIERHSPRRASPGVWVGRQVHRAGRWTAPAVEGSCSCRAERDEMNCENKEITKHLNTGIEVH